MSLKSLYGTEPRAEAAAALGWWSLPACAIGLCSSRRMPYSCIEGETGRGGDCDGHRLLLLDRPSGEGCCGPPAGAEGLICSSDITRPLSTTSSRLQGRRAPRGAMRLDPRCGPDGASPARRAYSRRGAQIRGKHQKHQVLPLSRHSEDGPAGAGERCHLHSPPGGSLSKAPQVGKGRSPTMQGIRRPRG